MKKQVLFKPVTEDDFDWPQWKIEKDCASHLWYSNAQLKEFANQAKLAVLAVNDACGDFDVTCEAEINVKSVLAQQLVHRSPEHLASISRAASRSSIEIAHLYGVLLEKEVAEAQAVTLEALSEIVNQILVDPQDEETDEDHEFSDSDLESIGTIDELFFETGKSKICKCDEVHCEAEDLVRQKALSPVSIISDCDDLDLSERLEDSGGHTSTSRKRQIHVVKMSSTSDYPPKPLQSDRRVRQRRSYQDDTQNRCNVAYALIALARWEFRGHRLYVL